MDPTNRDTSRTFGYPQTLHKGGRLKLAVSPGFAANTHRTMKCTFHAGDILGEEADILVCSANIFLNLSGGVGGEILLRYGRAMQDELHEYLAERELKFVTPGEVVTTSPGGTHFGAVVHAVAVNAFYETSPQLVTELVDKALRRAVDLKARRVALTSLATGYGRLSMAGFGDAIRPLMGRDYPVIEEVIVCVRSEPDAQLLRKALAR